MLTIDYANIKAYTNIINGLILTYWHWGNPLWLPLLRLAMAVDDCVINGQPQGIALTKR
jgi:hypothetical protein